MQVDEVLNKKGAIFKLTFSSFVISFLSILVNNVDQLMISRYSQTSVAAVGNANQVSWILLLLLTVVSNASVILIAQYKGAKNKELEQETYAVSVVVNVVLSLIIGAVLIAFGRGMFRLMNITDPIILEQAYVYMAITGGSTLFTSMLILYEAFFKSNAMLKESLIVSIGVNLFNILGNWLLIYGIGPFPELGYVGAAISTVVSRVLGAIILIIVFSKRVGKIDFSCLKPFPMNRLKKLFAIGIPSAGEGFSYDAAQLVIMSFINTLGLVAVNTKIYVALIVSFAYILTMSIGEVNQVVVGYMLGAKLHDRANSQVMKSLLVGVLCSVTLTVGLYFASDFVIGLFMSKTDPQVVALRSEILALAKHIMIIEIFLEAGRAINLVMVRSLQGAGDVKFPVIMCIISSWCCSVLGGYILGVKLGYGLAGIWIGIAMDEILRGIVLIFRWKGGRWRKIDIVTEPAAKEAVAEQ